MLHRDGQRRDAGKHGHGWYIGQPCQRQRHNGSGLAEGQADAETVA